MKLHWITAPALVVALAASVAACGKKDPPSTGDSAPPGRVLSGPFTGVRVSGAADLTADGAPDVLISAPGVDSDGAVRIFDAAKTGSLGAADATASIVADAKLSIGEGLAPCGDVDGDGVPDLAIGMPLGNATRGGVWILSGPFSGERSTDEGLLVRGTKDGGQAGYTVACGGDFDGNGTADLAFSAPQADGFGIATVSGQVQFHVTDAGATDAIANFSTTWSNETLGYHRSLAISDDLDGDGLADAVIGGPGAARIHVLIAPFAGTLDGNSTGMRYDGREDDDDYGHSVATGDLDGDGYIDVAAGAPRYGPQNGAVGIVHGPFTRDDGLISAPDQWIDGQDPRELTGFAIAIANDLDGDGLADLLASAPGSTTSGPEAGVVYGILGPASIATVASAQHVIVGNVPFAQLGHSLAAVPDANGDGLDEVLVGAPYRDDGETVGAGAALLFHSPLPARIDDSAASTTYIF